MMESERLSFIWKNQKKLRVAKYCDLAKIWKDVNIEGSKKGKRVVLPSSYVGSRRFMEQIYFYGMTIYSHIGCLYLFITLTCNPNWSKVQRLISKINLRRHDRPYIISRLFKIKFNELLSDLTKKHVLGKVVASKSNTTFLK